MVSEHPVEEDSEPPVAEDSVPPVAEDSVVVAAEDAVEDAEEHAEEEDAVVPEPPRVTSLSPTLASPEPSWSARACAPRTS